MKWFVAKVCYQIIASSGAGQPQFDEQFRLISARGPAEALEKAQGLGAAEDEVFLSSSHQPVHWKWLGVTELNELAELTDGTELFAASRDTVSAADYLSLILQRSQMLQHRVAHWVEEVGLELNCPS